MGQDRDPFFHHPELRGEIADPLTSSWRELTTAGLAAKAREHGLLDDWWHSDAEREALRTAALARHGTRDLWVFAYGSLMWDPGFRFAEVRRARLPGHVRRFILKDIYGGRGTEAAPGLMAALDAAPEDPQAACDGLLYRIEGRLLEAESAILCQRELIGPGYHPEFVTAYVEERPVTALTFLADHSAEIIDGNVTRQEQVHYIATGSGFLGSSLEYLRKVAHKLALLGIRDRAVESLLREAEAYAETHGG